MPDSSAAGAALQGLKGSFRCEMRSELSSQGFLSRFEVALLTSMQRSSSSARDSPPLRRTRVSQGGLVSGAAPSPGTPSAASDQPGAAWEMS